MECDYCHKEFIAANRKGVRFCSIKCKDDYWAVARRRIPVDRVCVNCGKIYRSFSPKYCSKACMVYYCSRAAYRKKSILIGRVPRNPKPPIRQRLCVTCGGVLPSGKIKYCSDDCYPKKTVKYCDVCGIVVPRGHRNLCSLRCRNIKSKSSLSERIRGKISQRVRRLINGERRSISYRGNVVKLTDTQLRTHFEKRFKPGMTWDNYGTYWHIDHIVPLRAFNLACDEDIKKCWDLKNLQPLVAIDNLKKGAILESPYQQGLI
jgi:predicted nucleic acid-binding Zn ribbon protein